jgi:hypothetical protein
LVNIFTSNVLPLVISGQIGGCAWPTTHEASTAVCARHVTLVTHTSVRLWREKQGKQNWMEVAGCLHKVCSSARCERKTTQKRTKKTGVPSVDKVQKLLVQHHC